MLKIKKLNKLSLSIALAITGTATASVAGVGGADVMTHMANEATGAVVDSIAVLNKQTVLNMKTLSEEQQRGTKEVAAVRQGLEQVRAELQIRQESQLGTGLTPGLLCNELEDKETYTVRQSVAKQAAVADQAILSAKAKNKSVSESNAEKVQAHTADFCPQSQAARGQCTLPEVGRGAADIDYNTYGETQRLGDAQLAAAYRYVENLIPFEMSKASNCDSDACRQLALHENRYNAIANVAQGALIRQIHLKQVSDTKPRLAKMGLLEQKEDEIVGDFDGVTVHPETGEVSGMPTVTAGIGMSIAGESVAVNEKTAVIIGDSIAHMFNSGKSPYSANGRNAGVVLQYVKKAIADGATKTAPVIISTGIANSIASGSNPKQRIDLAKKAVPTIRQQFQALKDAGAHVVVLSVASNMYAPRHDSPDTEDGIEINKILQGLANEYGFAFMPLGKYSSKDGMKIHPPHTSRLVNATRAVPAQPAQSTGGGLNKQFDK